MSSSSTPRPHVELDHDRVLDDERPVPEPDEVEEIDDLDRLERGVEVPEADAVEQHLAVPLDDDEPR